MAFSTQITFFHIPFNNETEELGCVQCAKLKKYESSFDDRSWSSNFSKKSHFIVDLVKCNISNFRKSDGTGTDN